MGNFSPDCSLVKTQHAEILTTNHICLRLSGGLHHQIHRLMSLSWWREMPPTPFTTGKHVVRYVNKSLLCAFIHHTTTRAQRRQSSPCAFFHVLFSPHGELKVCRVLFLHMTNYDIVVCFFWYTTKQFFPTLTLRGQHPLAS
jgi:hypothetical protein